jgi:hypothetical protein
MIVAPSPEFCMTSTHVRECLKLRRTCEGELAQQNRSHQVRHARARPRRNIAPGILWWKGPLCLQRVVWFGAHLCKCSSLQPPGRRLAGVNSRTHQHLRALHCTGSAAWGGRAGATSSRASM